MLAKGHGNKLRRLYWPAVKALLEANGDVPHAAEKVGVNRKTLRRWLKEPEFADQVASSLARIRGKIATQVEDEFLRELLLGSRQHPLAV